MKHTAILPTLMALFFLLAAVVLAASAPAVDWWVIGGGGGHTENGDYALDGTSGQTVVGVVGIGQYRLCSGFRCAGMGPGHTLFLPLILKNWD
jgi:hypothetical protein